LGLASSYPVGHDHTRHALAAHSQLKKIFKPTNTLKKTEISQFYSTLRWHLKKLKPLIPEKFGNIVADIDKNIKTCTLNILPIDTFKEMIEEGDEICIKNSEGGRAIYKQALEFIGKEKGIEFQMGRVRCLLRLTSTYPNGSSELNKYRAATQEALFNLYHFRDKISKSGQFTEVEAYETLERYLTRLLSFTPSTDTENQEEINRRIRVCTTRLNDLREPKSPAQTPSTTNVASATQSPVLVTNTQTLPVKPVSDHVNTARPISESGKLPRKVTQEAPSAYNKLEGIFISCIVIALIAIAGMALYRRNTVTVSN